MKIKKIGIDLGTTYSFAGFLHGDRVMPLIPSRETYGIPSVFYYDGINRIVGRMAERRALNNPQNAVWSVKRNLSRKDFLVGGRRFTPKEIIREIIAYIVSCAEQQLTNVYLEEYDEIEAVITVPVDFTEPMKNLIREAGEQTRTANGKPLRITGILEEPVAAAMEYFGVRKEQAAEIVVFDLGGGTFDAAIVRAHAQGTIPYEVIDQEGDRSLGGDDWDRLICDRIIEQYQRKFGEKPARQMESQFLIEARKIKEELTELESVDVDIPVKGSYITFTMSRKEFELMSRPLLDRALQKIRMLLSRQPDTEINHVILTGGSSYMPQIMNGLRQSGIFGQETDFLFIEPEHAIAYGAARYAVTRVCAEDMLIQPEKMVIRRSAHAYGIEYHFEDQGRDLVRIIIPRGVKLPYSGTVDSYTRVKNQRCSVFDVYEADCAESEEAVKTEEAHQIMQVEMNRKEIIVPIGTRTSETLTLSSDGLLSIKSIDHNSGIEVNNSVSIQRFMEE